MQDYIWRFARDYPLELQRKPGLTESTVTEKLNQFKEFPRLWNPTENIHFHIWCCIIIYYYYLLLLFIIIIIIIIIQ